MTPMRALVLVLLVALLVAAGVAVAGRAMAPLLDQARERAGTLTTTH